MEDKELASLLIKMTADYTAAVVELKEVQASLKLSRQQVSDWKKKYEELTKQLAK